MPTQNPPPKKINIQVQIDDDVAQGSYTNLVMINHTETEFVLDFIYVQPQQPKAKVHSRIICSPKHTKQLLRALGENVNLHEQKFGQIPLPTTAGPKLVH